MPSALRVSASLRENSALIPLSEKLAASRERIAGWLAHFRSPCILWSSGKDSQVLLHLLRSMGHDLPVVTFQEPWQRGRLNFTQQVASDWNLTLYDFPPSELGLNRGNGRIDIMQRFQLGNFSLWLARGTEPPREGEPFQCGIDWLSRPTGGMQFPWDAAFHGQKSSDEDPSTTTPNRVATASDGTKTITINYNTAGQVTGGTLS